MMTFKEGDFVGVPCSIQLGPFPDEKLITVQASDGPPVGFVRVENLESDEDERGRVRGVVARVGSDTITVRLFGSFFTTALGFASVTPSGLTRLAA